MDRKPTEPVQDAAIWDQTAADYEALAEPFTRQYAVQALALSGGVGRGDRVLDVAAGTGALTLAAARAGASVSAIDFSPGMTARLRSRLAAEGLDAAGSQAQVMDGQALDLADAAFDAVFSIFGVMLFPDHRRGLAEMVRVLRPGGRAVVASWAGAVGAGPTPVLLDSYQALFPERTPPDFPPGLRRLADPDALAEDMRSAGLDDVEVHAISGVWVAPSPDWMADNADRLYRPFPLWGALNVEERRRLSEEVRSRLSTGGSGEVRITSHANVGVGRRPLD